MRSLLTKVGLSGSYLVRVAAKSATLNFILNLSVREFWLSGTRFVDVSKDAPAYSLAGDGVDASARREVNLYLDHARLDPNHSAALHLR